MAVFLFMPSEYGEGATSLSRIECGRVEEALRESEERYRNLFNSMDEGFFLSEVIVDADGAPIDIRYLEANPAAIRMVGVEFVGRTLREVDAEFEPYWFEIWGRVARTGQPERHVRYARPVKAWYDFNIFRVGAPDSRRIAAVFRDVTRSRQADEEMRRTHAVIDGITTGTDDLIAAQDTQFRYTYFNSSYRREFQRLWGQEIKVGTSMVDALAPWPEEQRKAMELWARAHAGESFSVISEFGPKSDTQVYDLRFNPVRDAEGRQIGAAHFIRNVTEQVKTQQALRESELRFRSVVEAMSEGLMIFDPSGALIHQNAASLRIHGFDTPEKGKLGLEQLRTTWKVWDDQGRPLPFNEWPISRVMRGEWFQDQVLRVIRIESGDEFFGSCNGSPIYDEQGKLIIGFITIRDITAQKRAEAASMISEAHYRQLAESMPQLVWTANGHGVVDYYNHRIEKYVGASKGLDGQWQWQPMLHLDDITRTLDAWQHATAKGGEYQIEHRVQMVDGSYRWHLSRAYPGRDGTGRIVKWFGTATDIDDQKRAQEMLEQTVAERTARLRDTVAELEHFSYTITHDMRAPLRAMQAFGHILREEYYSRLDEMGADYLRRIIEAAQRMDNLITDSLNYAKAVQTELTLEPIDPGALLRGIVESYPQFHAPVAEIQLGETFAPVLANPAGLTQCISNLLGNAVKFVEPGKIPQVRVWSEVRGEMVRLWFEDNGIGIPQEHQERVFVMFQRLSKNFEGTGVGLALVKKVVEKMRGKVGLESRPGEGTRFWLDLGRVPPKA